MLSAADQRALLAVHQGHTPTELAACDTCRRVRTALALALQYTPWMADPSHPDDRRPARAYRPGIHRQGG
jgi:hypothetical protein